MASFHYVNGKCDELLANDIVRQLQTEIKMGFERNKQLLYGDLKGWSRGKWNSKCWFKNFIVTVGNDDYKVMALRSYDKIVGFICGEYMYEVGYYSKTTHGQFRKYFEKYFSDSFTYKIEYEKLS